MSMPVAAGSCFVPLLVCTRPWMSSEGDMDASIKKPTSLGDRDEDLHVCDPPHACLGCLSMSGLAAELTKDQVEALFKVVDIRRLSKGEILISEGEYDDRLYAIAKGEFQVTR